MKRTTIDRAISRRDLLKMIRTFGVAATATALTISGFSAAADTPTKEEATGGRDSETAAKKAKRVLRLGVSGHTTATDKVFCTGVFDFKRILERKTDGEIVVQIFGGNSLCTETTCGQKTLTGTLDMFCASTENTAATIPFLNALDFPYLWPSMASMYQFLYSKESNPIFRDVLRERYNLIPLFSANELRSLFLGSKWGGVNDITSPDQIKGMKIRVTGSELGALALQLLGANPMPLEWSDTLEGLNSGLIDGLEASSLSASAFNMIQYVTHELRVGLFPIFEMTMISRSAYESLSSAHQETVLESALEAQELVQKRDWHDLQFTVGALTDPPPKGSLYEKFKIKVDRPSRTQMDIWKELASAASNPKTFDPWKGKVKALAGGIDVYEGLTAFTNQITPPSDVTSIEAKKWW